MIEFLKKYINSGIGTRKMKPINVQIDEQSNQLVNKLRDIQDLLNYRMKTDFSTILPTDIVHQVKGGTIPDSGEVINYVGSGALFYLGVHYSTSSSHDYYNGDIEYYIDGEKIDIRRIARSNPAYEDSWKPNPSSGSYYTTFLNNSFNMPRDRLNYAIAQPILFKKSLRVVTKRTGGRLNPSASYCFVAREF